MFRTDSATLTHKGALPDSLMTGDEFLTGVTALVPGVHIVPLAEGNDGGSDKGGIEGIDGTGGITEQAVYAHGVLLEVSQFSRGLKVLTFLQWLIFTFLPDDVGLYLCQFCHKVIHFEDKITLYRKAS